MEQFEGITFNYNDQDLEIPFAHIEELLKFRNMKPVVCVGITGGGKTTLAIDVLAKFAKQANNVYFITLEELGVCWGLQANPTASEEHLSTAQWNEPFTCTLTELNHNTVYHVRAYAKQGSDYYYGADKTFTTEEKPTGNGTYNGHDYIDLGLPSGTLWAACNVGAETPEGLGSYFAWGETTTKADYDWSTYKYCNGSENTLTKYCNDAESRKGDP